jgi:predicted small secreted protein
VPYRFTRFAGVPVPLFFMKRSQLFIITSFVLAFALIAACSNDEEGTAQFENLLSNPEDGPPAGYSEGNYTVPQGAGPEDVSTPDQVVGDGTPESCTAEAFIGAMAKGGKIVFDCSPDPVTILLPEPAKIFNDAHAEVVIDGGGLVALDGGGMRGPFI